MSETVSTADLHQHYWRGYTLDHDRAAAAQQFTERYGQPPAHIIEARGLLLLGPIPSTSPAEALP